MERESLLPGSLAEFLAAHPEVTACRVEGVHRATIHLEGGGYGEVHAGDEAGLLAKLAAALG